MNYGSVQAAEANSQQPNNKATDIRTPVDDSPNYLHPSTDQDDDKRGDSFFRRIHAFYEENVGLFFVFLAQMFGSIVREKYPTQKNAMTDNNTRWP